MDIFIIDEKEVTFNEREVENCKWYIREGVLTVFGDFVKYKFSFNPVYDEQYLEKVREKYIELTWPLKRRYVSGWHQLKETEYALIRSNNFKVIDYNRP
jgi:hypothetical protein